MSKRAEVITVEDGFVSTQRGRARENHIIRTVREQGFPPGWPRGQWKEVECEVIPTGLGWRESVELARAMANEFGLRDIQGNDGTHWPDGFVMRAAKMRWEK